MCLILLAFQAHRDVTLLLAGNRDEFFRRPSAPPAVIAANPAIFAGRDLEAGGTWMGRNEAGLMAALTNRRNPAAHLPADARTRGEIVVKLLGHRQPELAAEWLEGLALDRYQPFSVLFGDPTRFYYFCSEEQGPPRSLAPGFYALSNSTLDDRSWPKVDRSHRFFEENRSLPGEELVEKIQAFLADATPPDDREGKDRQEEIHGALGAVFITTEVYGTVSSTLLTAGGTLGDRYYFAEGKALRNATEPARAFRQISFEG